MLELLALAGMMAVGVGLVASSDDDQDTDDVDAPVAPDPAMQLTGERHVDDLLQGGSGDDVLIGDHEEADRLVGGAGNDVLHVSTGNIVSGGGGQDVFHVARSNVSGFADMAITIEDFDPSEDVLTSYSDLERYAEVRMLEDGSGMGLFNQSNDELVLALPGVTDASDIGIVRTTDELLLSELDYDVDQDLTWSDLRQDRDGEASLAAGESAILYTGPGDDVITSQSSSGLIFSGDGNDSITAETNAPTDHYGVSYDWDYGYIEFQGREYPGISPGGGRRHRIAWRRAVVCRCIAGSGWRSGAGAGRWGLWDTGRGQ